MKTLKKIYVKPVVEVILLENEGELLQNSIKGKGQDQDKGEGSEDINIPIPIPSKQNWNSGWEDDVEFESPDDFGI